MPAEYTLASASTSLEVLSLLPTGAMSVRVVLKKGI
jgi:hypothetical protein